MPARSNALRVCPCVVLEDFLREDELAALLDYTLRREKDFQAAEVVTAAGRRGSVQRNQRRARLLRDAGEIGDVIRRRVHSYLPWVLKKLGLASFRVARIEAQITASNHGEFFRKHLDNTAGKRQRRTVSYVYYFHRKPRRFTGGELLIYPTWRRNGEIVFASNFRTIKPRLNRIVFFPSGILHEIRTVVCASRKLADSRFTVNGWVWR